VKLLLDALALLLRLGKAETARGDGAGDWDVPRTPTGGARNVFSQPVRSTRLVTLGASLCTARRLRSQAADVDGHRSLFARASSTQVAHSGWLTTDMAVDCLPPRRRRRRRRRRVHCTQALLSQLRALPLRALQRRPAAVSALRRFVAEPVFSIEATTKLARATRLLVQFLIAVASPLAHVIALLDAPISGACNGWRRLSCRCW
jgi:hypothetical protein